jgi:AAA+ ATPase superfamily predicted ATPase
MSEISTKVGEDTNVCSNYIKSLINLGIVQKETPYGEKPSRKSIYSIEDNMFRFWYRFVSGNNSIIARGATEVAYKRIEPHLSEYMGKVFEEICKQYLWEQLLNDNSRLHLHFFCKILDCDCFRNYDYFDHFFNHFFFFLFRLDEAARFVL